jgi:catechol 2,3-dioxygenase-like lactoylglutathione lyase family enzyme
MLDHVSLYVSDYDVAKEFYVRALSPLGIEVVMERDKLCGMGTAGRPFFWFGQRGGVSAPVHVALSAADRATVDVFHRAALSAGGTDNGAPGVRPHYHEQYYSAFVLDPDGHNIEAVCHRPDRVRAGGDG